MSKYFTIQELCHTDTGLQNIPTKEQETNLFALIDNVLDPVRSIYGDKIKVNSGFRSPVVNVKVGGKRNSQHMLGMAADITCKDNRKLFDIIKDNFEFDQLIDECNYSWIHVSFSRKGNRSQILHLP